jgi:Tfp pilus assembly protein PilF
LRSSVVGAAALEHAVEQVPQYADAWAMLSLIYKEEFEAQGQSSG